MATFITARTVDETINIRTYTSTGYWKYNHNGSDSTVYPDGWILNELVTNANGEFTMSDSIKKSLRSKPAWSEAMQMFMQT